MSTVFRPSGCASSTFTDRGRTPNHLILASSPFSANVLAKVAPVDIFGDGQQTRDFIYVTMSFKPCSASMALRPINSPVLTYAPGLSTSVETLAGLIAALSGRTLRHGRSHHAPARSDIPLVCRAGLPFSDYPRVFHCLQVWPRCWRG